jgi:hypothetical protein
MLGLMDWLKQNLDAGASTPQPVLDLQNFVVNAMQ